MAHRFRPHIVHAHYASAFGLWAIRTKIHPTVVSVWGSDVVDFPSNLFARQFIRKVLRSADWITATSRYLETTVGALMKDRPSNMSVIPFGVDSRREIVSPPPAPPVRLCYIKAHKQVYGPDVLLKALREVLDRGCDVHLSMAGSGPETAGLKALAVQLKLNGRVDFVGRLDQAGVYRLLENSHIMVMPSRREAFGVAVLEAAACARPVIATRVGGIPEVVSDRDTGVLVPPDDVEALADAVVELARDERLRQTMGRAGHRYAEDNYSWARSLDMMSALYERLLYEKT